MKPEYKNCQLNLIASIEKHYGDKTQHFAPIPEIDELLVGKKHIFLIVLDGLGTRLVEENLSEHSFIREHYFKTMSTLYPSTTTCVTIALRSGKLPNDTGFYAWHQYFPEHNRDIVLFKNTDYYTGERINGKIPLTFRQFFDRYENVSTYSLYPKWSIEQGYKNFDAQVEKMIDISSSNDNTFTYCYYDEPDETIHKYGTKAGRVKKLINKLDKGLAKLEKGIKKDSIVFMVADHGLIDCETIYLEDYPDIIDLLTLKPTLESRITSFKVSDMGRFKRLFEHHFPIGFELYTKDEYLKSDYVFHTNTAYQFEPFLFDYVAVANDKFCFQLKRGIQKMKAAHAGSTEEEMLVPLVVFESREKKESK